MMNFLRSGIKPNIKISQHFLINPSIAERIVHSMEIKEGEFILEVGPGEGILTEFLLASRAERIVGIEIDSRLIKWLKDRFCMNHRFQLIEGDFLKFDLSTIIEKNKKLRLVGNLPYGITSPILFHVLSFRENIKDMTIMVQKEVGERLISKPGSKKYGIPSVIFQYFCEVKKLFAVSRNAFSPKPEVDSSMIHFKFRCDNPYHVEDLDLFFRVVKMAFGQRRKMLKNSLQSLIENHNIKENRRLLQKRPENLSVKEFVDLSNQLIYKN